MTPDITWRLRLHEHIVRTTYDHGQCFPVYRRSYTAPLNITPTGEADKDRLMREGFALRRAEREGG